MQSTDNPIDKWSDQQLAEAARQTLKTLRELCNKLNQRGYSTQLDHHPSNYIPTTVRATKVVQL